VLILITLGLLVSMSGAYAAPLTLMTWNIEGAEVAPAALAKRVERALKVVGPVEVLVLQEVVAEDQVRAAADAGGFAYWAMSDFSPPIATTKAWHKSLEVAIISRRRFTAVYEWDTTGPLPEGDRYPPRTSTGAIETRSLRLAAEAERMPSRGFLRVDLAGGWTVYGVHWKSSRGAGCTTRDRVNARLREVQAAGLSGDAAKAIAAGRTIIVAGDLNIQAPGRALRVGTDPKEDCTPTGATCEGRCGPGGKDGYDDSTAILLAVDPSAKLLSAELDSTYMLRRFPGGAIDHILVAGPRSDSFAAAFTPPAFGKRWNGSDHRPVIAK